MLLVKGVNAVSPLVTSVLRIWMGQGEFRLVLEILALRAKGFFGQLRKP